MPKPAKIAPPASPWDSETRLLAWLATCVSVFSFLFYFKYGDVLLYGDAVAHINIARRVFDSKTPGLLQLGTVWLPLPHLLMIPFLLSDEMWRRGLGGSIPSMAAYVFGVIGMFRLLRATLSRNSFSHSPLPDSQALNASPRLAAWIGALMYAANPNLIYMQTTAMGESLYLAFFVWAIVYLSEFVRGDAKALTKCGLCLAAACLTRYDGWFLAAVVAGTMFAVFSHNVFANRPTLQIPRAAITRFVLLAAAGPVLWLAYNGIVYRNPLEFANGPYSARAIERRTQTAGYQGHPGGGNPLLAGMYFLKSAEADAAANEWLGRGWILVAVAGGMAAVLSDRRKSRDAASPGPWPLLLLLVPVPFYALSVAYGGVPIFVPAWWPFAHYNVRYGLQLLPAFAAALGILVYRVIVYEHWRYRFRLACVMVLLAFVIACYATIWHSGPISLEEAQINMRSRHQLETQLASWLEKLPPDSTLLMYLGDHVGAVQQAGIPLKRVINEGNHRPWKQPSDPDGLWERALADPARYADYVIAFEGDRVWQAMQSRHLPELVEIHVTGQARGILYRAR
ncbi:MAG TPA: hypothetical protein VGM18_05770 [Candidatus Sulfotelmatobacter sp.]|jgi:hypothetical protein